MLKLFAVVAGIYVAACMVLDVRDRLQRPPVPPQRTDLVGILPHVERAAKIAQKLAELDDLQTNLELVAPREYAQAVRMEWVNRSGRAHSVGLWMDGSPSTAQVRAAVTSEKQMLTAALLDEISLAYIGSSETKPVTAAAGLARYRFDTAAETETTGEEAEDA